MARIENQGIYPLKASPINADYIIGTDSENGGETVSFSVASFKNVVSGTNLTDTLSRGNITGGYNIVINGTDRIESATHTAQVFNFTTSAVTHTIGVISGASLTTGKLLQLISNSPDVSSRNLMEIINDDPLATGTTLLNIRNDSTGLALDSIGSLKTSGALVLSENATVPFPSSPGTGVVWVKNTVPSSPFYTDDTGVDFNLGIPYDNQIVVKQANAISILGGAIDSTKEYFLDGVIDMGATSIEVPVGGINITGYDFNISGLTSSATTYTMFTSPVGGSGDILWADFKIEVTGTGSQVLDVESSGSKAFEIARINFNNCTSLGEIDNYRQGLETGTGRFGGTPNLILTGAWSGGYFIDTSIVRNLTDGSYSLYEAGTAFTMASRFRSNQNIDLNTTVSLFDFAPANFPNPNTLQLDRCIVTRNGVVSPEDGTITPNIDQTNLVSRWEGNIGLPNTFIGGTLNITAEITTTITIAGTYVDLAGTFTSSDLQHFDSPSSGQLRHLGDSPREYKFLFTGVLDSTANDEIDLKVVIWDNSASVFVDGKITRRVVNNLQANRDVAFFTVITSIILDTNDYVKVQVANVNATNNITAELDVDIIVEQR
tara:strand:+ start:6455 stop:8266 length:1812 start_codon:yes stop_codon:yes gene_type:complete